MNNHHKIISFHGAPPLKYGRDFFQEKLSLKDKPNFLGKKFMLSLLSFNIISGNPHVDALIIGSGLPKNRSGSLEKVQLKRYLLVC